MSPAQVSSLTNVIESSINCLVYLSVANYASSWHVATAEVGSAYKAFSVERIMGKVGVSVECGPAVLPKQIEPSLLHFCGGD